MIFVALFFATWFVLKQIDWIKHFKVKQTTKSLEEKLGDLIWKSISASEGVINDKKITNAVDSILTKICKANNIDRTKIKLHIVKNSEVNAFALPNNYLLVNSGLILNCVNEGELASVMAHEIAHIQLNHVMEKVVLKMGMTVLVTITSGGGGEMTKEILHLLTSTAYDRTLESEADAKAVDYLIASNMDPENFANFLFRLSGKEDEWTKRLEMISTHPNSKERAEAIIELCKDKKFAKKQVLSPKKWIELQDRIKEMK